MSNVIILADWKRAHGMSEGLIATAARCQPSKPAFVVMARISTRDQHIAAELDVSDFLQMTSNVGLCALLTLTNSWAESDLVQWAVTRNQGVREVLEYMGMTRDTKFGTELQVQLNGAQARVWLQVHHPEIALALKATKLA